MALRNNQASGKVQGAQKRTSSFKVGSINNFFAKVIPMITHLLTTWNKPKYTHTDEYGNLFTFDSHTSEATTSAIQACTAGRINRFAKTDNMEIRMAPTISKRDIPDIWKITKSCPDTGSEVCLNAQIVAEQVGAHTMYQHSQCQSLGCKWTRFDHRWNR